MTKHLDRRLHAFRPDLADSRLRGQVEAAFFVDGQAATVQAPVVDLRPAPDASCGIDTQLLRGQKLTLFDQRDGWAWVQAHADGYVGYCALDAIDTQADAASWQPTHRVIVPSTFTYQEPNLKTPIVEKLSMGSALAIVDEVEQRGTRYAITERGEALIARHLSPLGVMGDDYVAVAETLLHAPYLWGGTSALGIDCSGLVQLSMAQCGHQVLRDSDMQAATVGTVLPDDAALQRGDLVFWKGHVGIMRDAETLLHANGNTMSVALEPLALAIERIGYLYGQPTLRRRP